MSLCARAEFWWPRGVRPRLAPGLTDAESQTAKIREWSRAMFEAPGARGHVVTDETKLGEQLHAALAADVAMAREIGFVHRKLAYGDIYFLANTSNHPVHSQATFRVSGLESAWFDPFTGKVTGAGGNRIDLDLAPYESRVVVFSKQHVAPRPAPTGPAPAPVDLSSGWKVTFAGINGAGRYDRAALLDRGRGAEILLGPRDLRKDGDPRPDDGCVEAPALPELRRRDTRDRGGTAIHLRHAAMLEGPVREAAVVTVNGKPAGSVWCAPYEVEVSGLLHAGENTIRVGRGQPGHQRNGPRSDCRITRRSSPSTVSAFRTRTRRTYNRCHRVCWARCG